MAKKINNIMSKQTFTRDQLIKADLKSRQHFKSNPEYFGELEDIPTLKQSVINIDYLIGLME